MTKSTGIGRGRNSGGKHNPDFAILPKPSSKARPSAYVAAGNWRCADSPTGAHYWKIPSGKNQPSTCEYCTEERNFTPIDSVPFNPSVPAKTETAGELTCRVCGESKPEDQFHKKLIGRYDAECRACQTERKKRATGRQPEENTEERRAAATAIARGLR